MFYTPIWPYRQYELAKRPDTPNLYIVWYDNITGKYERKSTRTADLALAQERLIEFATAQDRLASPERMPEPHEVQIEEVIRYYLERHMTPANPSRRTADANLKAIRRFAEEETLHQVSDLHPDVLDLYPEFRNRLFHENQLTRMRQYRPYRGWSEEALTARLKDISDATIGRELSVLNAALQFYRKRGRITQVPFIQLPPAVPARARWLTPEEFGQLHRAATAEHLRDFLLLSIKTLQRPGLIYGLRVDQVDLTGDLIDFLPPATRQTRKRRPAIRIAETLRPTLKRLVQNSQSGYVLEYDGQPIRTDVRRAFNTAVEKAGLGGRRHDAVIPYTLRHTGATWLAQAGVDLWQIAGMLGHRDTRMVERVYAKHHPEFQRRATEVLDQLVNAA